MYLSHDHRRTTIATLAWKTWAKDGLGMDAPAKFQSRKLAREAVDATYQHKISDARWITAAIRKLRSWDTVAERMVAGAEHTVTPGAKEDVSESAS